MNYTQYDPDEDDDQDLVGNSRQQVTTASIEERMQATLDNDSDPGKEMVRFKVKAALLGGERSDGQPGLTIGDICDLVGFKEGFVRDRLSELVAEGHLACIPGSGRRPSYYLLPDDLRRSTSPRVSKEEGQYLLEPSEDIAYEIVLASIERRIQGQEAKKQAIEKFLLRVCKEIDELRITAGCLAKAVEQSDSSLEEAGESEVDF
jgi:hypothetical protein